MNRLGRISFSGLSPRPIWQARTAGANVLGKAIVLLALWAFLLTMPYWTSLYGGYIGLATRVLVLGLGGIALNFLLGFTGVVSFGHAAYFGVGAYGTAMTLAYLVPSTPLAVLIGVTAGTVVSVAVGGLIRKLRGIYFAVVTIAFGQIFYYIAIRWSSVTGGDDGLVGWTRAPVSFGFTQLNIAANDVAFYYLVLFVFAISVGVMALLLRSPFGQTLIAIRENERRAVFLGLPVDQHIWIAFVISCFFMSLAGGLYALLNNFAGPHSTHWTMSGDFVMMVILGGMRSFLGPLVGAILFVVLQDVVSSYTQYWMFVIGLVFMAVVLYFPQGLLGIAKRKSIW